MKYRDLRDFLEMLRRHGDLLDVGQQVDPHLDMTAVCDAMLRRAGPALWFAKPTGYDTPVLGNLFGTVQRVALGMGAQDISELRRIGEVLAALRQPEPPRGLKDAGELLRLVRSVWDMRPSLLRRPPCQQQCLEGSEVDLHALPLQTCWPGDAAPLLTWGLVVTRGPRKPRQNLGIYRQQRIGRKQLIMRWLSHRGGAQDFRDHAAMHPGQPFPIAVALGADPATILGAVTPVPDSLSEYQFAGLLRGARTELADCIGVPLQVPAHAEIVLEVHIPPAAPGWSGRSETGVELKEIDGWLHALEGPFGDHTGYYNEQEWFPVFEVQRITRREQAFYHSTYTGKPPDEPAVLGAALGEVFVPLLRQQFPEITDVYLPPEGCSYRLAVVSMRKQYAGHGKRVMMGLWSFLRQFLYTKFIIVTDDDVDIRDWRDVIWAVTTRMDPVRDTTLIDNTPIDYLDFASPQPGLGGKIGLDATHKWPGETSREWGRPIHADARASQRAQQLLEQLWPPGRPVARPL